MDILDRQIKNTVERSFTIHMHYIDCEPEHLGLVDSDEGGFLKCIGGKYASLSRTEFEEILQMASPSVLTLRESDAKCGMRYDDFWNKYYNNRQKIKLA